MPDFDEIKKQMDYQEWRQRKIVQKYEILTDPGSAIWNYIDDRGNLVNSNNEHINLYGRKELMYQLEKAQNVFYITIKRRNKCATGSDEWILFNEKIEATNRLINEISAKLLED